MIVKKITGVYQGNLSAGSSSLPTWVIDYLDLDGKIRSYVFPHAALTYRAAEYGIDLDDAETLLDIVLHEHYMDPGEHSPYHPSFLYNTDEETARLAHLARVQKVKQYIAHEDPDNLLRIVTQHHVKHRNEALHSEHRAVVASLRSNKMKAMRGKK